MKNYCISILFFFLLSAKSFAAVVWFITPTDDDIYYIPSQQNYMDIQVSWDYELSPGENSPFHFELVTSDLGTFNFPSNITSYTVENVTYGSKAWRIKMVRDDGGELYNAYTVYFNVYLTTITITADNNFIIAGGSNHGSIKVDGNNRTAPWYFQKDVNQNLTLEAVTPQTDNQGFQRIWNTSSCQTSDWENGGIHKSYNQTYSFTVAESDLNTTYMANFYQNRVTANGTLSANENWISNISLTGNVIIPSGITLILSSCANINLGSYSIISTGGTIVEDGATINGLAAKIKNNNALKGLCPSIQAAIDNSSDYNTIEPQSGTFQENLNISNKTGINLDGVAPGSTIIDGEITLNNMYASTLSNFTCTSAISYNNCVSTNLWFVDIDQMNQDCNIYVYDCTNTDLTIYGDQGLGCWIEGSTISAGGCQLTNLYEAFEVSSSTVYLDTDFFCNNLMDIDILSNSFVQAWTCTFSSDPQYCTSGSVLDIKPDYSICSGMQKSSDHRNMIISNNVNNLKDDSTYYDYESINNLYAALLVKIKEGVKKDGKYCKEKFAGDFKQISDKCRSFITENPNSVFLKSVFSTSIHCYKGVLDYEGMKDFVDDMMNNQKSTGLSGFAKRYLVDYYNYQKNFAKAISVADEIIKEYPLDKDLICDITFSKGLMYQYSLSQNDDAIKCYQDIITNYPDNEFVKPAKHYLRGLGIDIAEKKVSDDVTTKEQLEFTTNNYPNPFNPTTTISYSLPEDGRVQIKIYDALGRQVATLLDNIVSAGKHTIEWNGSNSASGIYFYSISFKGQMLYKKMLLVK